MNKKEIEYQYNTKIELIKNYNKHYYDKNKSKHFFTTYLFKIIP